MTITELPKETTSTGAFNRQGNAFTTPFGDGAGQLPVEPGRYRLVVSKSCPWANRQLIVRELLGLQDAISVGIADPRRAPRGWRFSLDADNRDPVLGIEYLTEAYEAADPTYDLRPTVPAIVDVTTGKVVNNDYPTLPNQFEVAWREFQAPDAPDLYPEHLRADIDELNDYVFDRVNNGVYKCGFARSQQAYEQAFDELFEALDVLDERLADRRFLFGDHITDTDLRLYVTLARFDGPYYVGFKANRSHLWDFENLWPYARDLYQTPGFGSLTDFEAIKQGYFGSPDANGQVGIVPKGPDTSIWNQPHGREHLGGVDKFLRH